MLTRSSHGWLVRLTLAATLIALVSSSAATASAFPRNLIVVGTGEDINFITPCVNGLQVDVNGGANPGVNVTSIGWAWGDGTTSTEYFPASHLYSTPGNYTISAIANFIGGGTASTSATVAVEVGELSNCEGLTISSETGGTVSYTASIGSGTVASGTQLTIHLAAQDDLALSAVPDGGYEFGSWVPANGIVGLSSGPVAGSTPSIGIVVTSTSDIVANFIANDPTVFTPPAGSSTSSSGATLDVESSLEGGSGGYSFTLQIQALPAQPGTTPYFLLDAQDANSLVNNVLTQLGAAGLGSSGKSSVFFGVVPSDVYDEQSVALLDDIVGLPGLADTTQESVESFGQAAGYFVPAAEVVADQSSLGTLTNPPELVTSVVNSMFSSLSGQLEGQLLESGTYPLCVSPGDDQYVPEYVSGIGQALDIVVTGLKSPSTQQVDLTIGGTNAYVSSAESLSGVSCASGLSNVGFQASAGSFSAALILNQQYCLLGLYCFSSDFDSGTVAVGDPQSPFIGISTQNLQIQGASFNSSSASLLTNVSIPQGGSSSNLSVRYLIPDGLLPASSPTFSLTLNGTAVPYESVADGAVGFYLNVTVNSTGTLDLSIPTLPPTLGLSTGGGDLFVVGGGFAAESPILLTTFNGTDWQNVSATGSLTTSALGSFVSQTALPATQFGRLLIQASDAKGHSALASTEVVNVTSFSATPCSSATSGVAILLNVSANDSDGEPLMYRFTANGGANWTAWSNLSYYSYPTSSTATGFLTFSTQVSDGYSSAADGPAITCELIPPVRFHAVFSESTLPSGTAWSVTLNGSTNNTTGTSLGFSIFSGEYSYSVGSVAGFSSSPDNGTVAVDAANLVRVIDFTRPGISLNPSRGPAGAAVTVSGIGFSVGSAVSLVFASVNVTSCANGSLHIANSGTFSCSLRVPSGSAGGIVSVDGSGSQTARARFLVTTPGIIITPKRGPIGDAVGVNGKGFSSSSVISLDFDGVIITSCLKGSLSSNSIGSFDCGFAVPSGTNGIAVTAIDVGGALAAGRFVVTIPKISVNPASGPIGVNVTVKGIGFSGDSMVLLSFDGVAIDSCANGSLTDNAKGAFTCTFSVPTGTSGSTVIATDAGGQQAVRRYLVT